MASAAREDAIVLANRAYRTPDGKVAHGLIRGSERFRVTAVVDPDAAGLDAGEALDGHHRAIPILATVNDAIQTCPAPPRWCVLGVAPHGGRFNEELHAAALEALRAGMGLINGLHDLAGEDETLARAAADAGVGIIDLRRPPPARALHFWTGQIRALETPRIAVLGTDCAIGKRTTARVLLQQLRQRGHHAEMIYTGQTGWLQGGRHGFILDATPNDYVSGELEHAILTCARETAPDIMLLEGQSSLRNPSGPCGAEFLLSGAANAVILQHDPQRSHYDGLEAADCRIPAVADEVALIRHYGVETIGITLFGRPDDPKVAAERERLADELQLPVSCPLFEDPTALLKAIENRLPKKTRL